MHPSRLRRNDAMCDLQPIIRYGFAELPGIKTKRAVTATKAELCGAAVWHVQGNVKGSWNAKEMKAFCEKYAGCKELLIDVEEGPNQGLALVQQGSKISMDNLAKKHAKFQQITGKPTAIYGLNLSWQSVTSPIPDNLLKAADKISKKFDDLIPWWWVGVYPCHETAEDAYTFAYRMTKMITDRTDKPAILGMAPWMNAGNLKGRAAADSITAATCRGGIDAGAEGAFIWDHASDSWHKGTPRFQQQVNAQRDDQMSRTMRLVNRTFMKEAKA